MKSSTFVAALLSLVLSVGTLLCSCGSMQKAGVPNDLKGETYSLPAGSGSHVRVKIADVRFNGKPRKVEKGSLEEEAIRDGVKDFVALSTKRRGTGRLSGAALDVSIDGICDGHAGRAAMEGALTGFFTLGLVGHVTPGRVTYTAQNSVVVTRSDGARRTFEATSGAIDGKYDMNAAGANVLAVITAQREADRQCFTKIANDLASSGFLK